MISLARRAQARERYQNPDGGRVLPVVSYIPSIEGRAWDRWMSLGSFSAPENEHKKGFVSFYENEQKKDFFKFFSAIKKKIVLLRKNAQNRILPT